MLLLTTSAPTGSGGRARVSTVDADVEIGEDPVLARGVELTVAREGHVGDMTVRRLLPLRLRRSVGAWCFVDHYGPMSVDGVSGMQVPPHPHIGLQTVTWLLAGDVLHRDSLGSEQLIRPGQLNLMTAGRGIAHAEESPVEHDPSLHGVQLWVALPEADRQVAPAFEHHAELPRASVGGFAATVFMGELAGMRSPATAFTPLVGAELAAVGHAQADLRLNPAFEHVIFVAAGTAEVDGTADATRPTVATGTAEATGAAEAGGAARGTLLRPGQLLYLGTGRDRAQLAAADGSRLFLLGGVPLGEPLLMWWNFVARTPEEIGAAVAQWREDRFGAVGGYRGEPLPAPPFDATRLRRPKINYSRSR
jgi:redox-sensitive bicupin YhaK (pirin superfamily)